MLRACPRAQAACGHHRPHLQLAVQASQLGGLEDQMFHRPLLDLNMMVRLHLPRGPAADLSADESASAMRSR